MFKSFGFLAGQTFKLFGFPICWPFDLSNEGHSRNASMSMFLWNYWLVRSNIMHTYIYI